MCASYCLVDFLELPLSRQKSIDPIDRKILKALCADGRRPAKQISEMVGLVPSVVGRRIERLREEGVILGFTAIIDGGALGLIDQFMRLQLQADRPTRRLNFEENVCAANAILSAKRLMGANDYMLRGYGTDFIDAVYSVADRSGVRIVGFSNDAIDLEFKPLRGSALPSAW